MILELFCGTAGLTAAFKRLNFSSSVAVDKSQPKFSHASVVVLDLTNSEHQALVLDWIRHDRAIAVFMAPPCGTCSLARNIPIENEPFAPRPLRSMDEPDGLQGLSDHERLRVSQANILYHFCQQVFDLCTQLNKPCMVENPLHSLFWMTTAWKEITHVDSLVYQAHQACAYGAKRPKWTLLAANFRQVTMINRICDNQHPHEPWGKVVSNGRQVFATSLEVHYPQKLCDAIAEAFLARLQQQYNFADSPFPRNVDFKAATSVQPRGSKTPVLFSPYHTKFLVLTDSSNHVCWPTSKVDLSDAKLLHESLLGVKVHEGTNPEHVSDLHSKILSLASDAGVDVDIALEQIPPEVSCIKIYGKLLTPEDFVHKACEVEHPLSVESCLPEVLHTTVKFLAATSDAEVATLRTEFIKTWLGKAKLLAQQESDLRTKMDPHINRVTKQKRIILFEQILTHLNYPDLGVVDELKLGVDLTGEVPLTGMLPEKRVPPLLTEQALRSRSSMVRASIKKSVGPSGDDDMDLSIWQQTLEEVKLGWLKGPLPEGEVPLSAPISRRFGVKQKSKYRPVDDFSRSAVNQAAGVSEAPALHTVDVIGAMLVDWLKCNRLNGTQCDLLLRTFDLKSAYRQIALSPAGRDVSYIVVFNSLQKRPEYFQCMALPFGAVRSVHSFLRLARAIWYIGVVGCKLAWSSFFDDFLVASRPSLARNTELTVVSLFKLIGWDFAESGKKCVPFDVTTEVLGVRIDASKSAEGTIQVANTTSRVDELVAELEDITQSHHVSRISAQKIRGRMQFADSQLFGRCGKRCIKVLGSVADGQSRCLDHSQKLQLKIFQHMLKHAPPRILSHDAGRRTLLFTDACYEPTAESWICGVGAVAIFEDSEPQYFSLCLNKEQREKLGALRKKQIIFEAETIAAVLAFSVWSKLFRHQRCILFVDNEGTKHSMISGASENPFVQAVVEIFASLEVDITVFLWIARVASASNIADEPSRGIVSKLVSSGAVSVNQVAASTMDEMISRAST